MAVLRVGCCTITKIIKILYTGDHHVQAPITVSRCCCNPLRHARADEKSGSDNVTDVMKTLREMPIHDAFARNAKLRADGKLIHDTYLVSVKSPAESKAPWDYYKIVKTVSGEDSFNPLSESQCPLVKNKTRN